MRVRGLVSLSTDPIGNRIEYGASCEEARAALEQRLRELRVPCWLVQIDVVVGTPHT